MTREEAYDFIRKESIDTQAGRLVYVSDVEKAVETIADDEELKEKAINWIYDDCERLAGCMQLEDAEYCIDIALGIENEDIYF